MPALILAMLLSAEPAPALRSLSGLNVPALKPWLIEQLPSLAQCVLPAATQGDEVVSVQAQFTKTGASVLKVEASLSDVACVRGVVETWRHDTTQPSAGSFSFKYLFKPSAVQREAVAAQARAALAALCDVLPHTLTREHLREAMKVRPPLPVGARVSLEDALQDTESQPAEELKKALSKALREVSKAFEAEPCDR